ncbi:hypothetical protein [Microbacterium arabinogalactanolyticum]|uniref:hypothetical protein n=1 Tax=Microbacterium arabinogalactanolyticum TaxID=69365 RepID=UPI00255769C2|nr:hypothetical protein [Microbacterium arabinogalactanolyticum]GLC86828.1 hypothetical protein MIAR_34130 [Microbacterium arabinogalactanolyticum]
MEFLLIIFPILYILAGAGLVYAVIRFAIVHALRQARNEARIERRVPKAATWLDEDERRLLDVSNASQDGTSAGH